MDITKINVGDIMAANVMYNSAGTTARREYRSRSAILMKLEGETEYTCMGKTVVSNATHPVFLPKGCSYFWKCTRSGRYAVIEFDTDIYDTEITSFVINDTERFKKLMIRAANEWTKDTPLRDLVCHRIIYELLILLEEENARAKAYLPSEKLSKILPAVEYINEHFREPLTNDFLASLTSVSTVYFRKVFTAAYHLSPISYLHALRIEKAKEMLKSDYGTLTNVATSVGYPNVYHFSKVFKKITGMSPGQYARQNV